MKRVPFSERPQQAEATYQVLRVRNGSQVTVCLLSSPQWVRMHWIDGRTFPCQSFGRQAKCRDKHHCWKGYSPAVFVRIDQEGHPRWQRCVMELPHEADLELSVGTPLLFKRSLHKPIGKLTCEPVTRMAVDLPAPFPVDASLWKLWGQT